MPFWKPGEGMNMGIVDEYYRCAKKQHLDPAFAIWCK